MQDRVAEVLEQRAALENGAAAGIMVSVLLHTVVAAVAIYAALRQPPTQTLPTIEIKFAHAAHTQPLSPQRKERIAEKPKPIEKTVPLSTFGKSTKKGSENPTPPKPATRQPVTPAPSPETSRPRDPESAPPLPGTTGATVEGDFPYTIYIDRMKNLIGGHWFRPQVAAGATTTVRFVVDRDGTVREASVESESGNTTFDRAALRAVLESSPLPPLPFAYSGNTLGVHLTFR